MLVYTKGQEQCCSECGYAILQEWLGAYHGAQSHFGQSGLLQQALILQMSNNTFNTLHVDTTGWNGQLPMLDLYYLVKRLTENGPALTLSQVANIAMMWITHTFIRLIFFRSGLNFACRT